MLFRWNKFTTSEQLHNQLSLTLTAYLQRKLLIQMDLFAKDHPLEAAVLRTQSVKRKFRSFEFEELPPAARHRIYRELLLKPKEEDDEGEDDDDSYASEHEMLSERIGDLMVEIGDHNPMHPAIMRTNKKIHEEAAAVLYGENWFTWSLYGDEYRPMWHCSLIRKIQCPRRYSRLITKIRIIISTRGDENDPTQAKAIYWTTTNVNNASKKLTLNDLKILKVDFNNGLGYRYGGSARKGYYGERCLEPLKKCRAQKFLINAYASPICASPTYAAELKAVIEGPKSAKFWAYRKAKEDEPESDYKERAELGTEELDLMEIVEGESGNEDEGGNPGM